MCVKVHVKTAVVEKSNWKADKKDKLIEAADVSIRGWNEHFVVSVNDGSKLL